MKTGALIIGDELLSGKRQDKHLGELIRMLAARGLKLSYAEYLGDDPERITAALQRAFVSGDRVFSFGGIGATPDDHTRAAAARALGVPLYRHAEATALIEARFGEDAYPDRVRMAEFPEGATLIPNPVNTIAGFSVERVHFVPGFPAMAWPMVQWVLENVYPDDVNTHPDVEKSLIALNAREGDLIPLMESFVARYPELKLSSLPSLGNERITGMHIEFGFTGPEAQVDAALAGLGEELQRRGYVLAERS